MGGQFVEWAGFKGGKGIGDWGKKKRTVPLQSMKGSVLFNSTDIIYKANGWSGR